MLVKSGSISKLTMISFESKLWSSSANAKESLIVYSLVVKGSNENSILFLDIKITRGNNKFMISVYRKPTFSRVSSNFGSFIPKSYKCNLLFILLHRALKLCSNFERFHQEIEKLIKITVTRKVLLIFVSKSTQTRFL